MAARQRNFLGLVSEQCIYSLADRTPELEVLPAAKHFGLGVVPWSPLGGGMLAGILAKGDEGRRKLDWAQAKLAKNRERVAKYEAFCREIGKAPADVALAWVLSNPIITSPIIGPRTLDHLKRSVALLDVHLDEATMKQLDEIWPGPGGTAPEAYSW